MLADPAGELAEVQPVARHHFIPSFYLSGFTDPATPEGQTPFLWVADARDQTVTRRAPGSVSQASGYYDWTIVPGIPSAERILGAFENRAAPVVRRLRRGEPLQGMKDKYDLANFLGFQIVRLPQFVDIITRSLQVQADEQVQEVLTDDRALAAFLESSKKPGQPPLTAEEVRASLASGRVQVRPTRDMSLSSSLLLAFHFAEILFAMRWTIVVNDEPTFFTTDQPLNLLTPDRTRPQIDFERGLNKHLEAFIALSPHRALLMHQEPRPAGTVLRVDRTKPFELQWLAQLPALQRYAYASSRAVAEWVLDQHRRCAPAWDLSDWPGNALAP